jgi:fatty acid desaturase
MKQTRKKVVWVIVIAMVLMGAGLLALGLALGGKLMLIALGVAMFFAAYLAHQSGMAYLDRLYGEDTTEDREK